MSATSQRNPPDGWALTSGVWGTDAYLDDAVLLSSAASLKMVGTSANTQTLVGSWLPLDADTVAYEVTSVLQATNNTSLFTLKLEVYGADKSTLLTIVYLYNNEAVPTANTWMVPSKELLTTTGMRWGRVILTRSAGATASIYLDRVEVKKMAPRWGCFKSNAGGDQALISSASNQLITFDTTDYANLVTPSTGTVTIYRAGVYLLFLRIQITGLAAGNAINISFRANDPVYGVISLGVGQYVTSSGSFLITHTSVYRHTGTLGAGTTVGAYVQTGVACAVKASPAGPSTNGNTAVTSWSGLWLGVG